MNKLFFVVISLVFSHTTSYSATENAEYMIAQVLFRMNAKQQLGKISNENKWIKNKKYKDSIYIEMANAFAKCVSKQVEFADDKSKIIIFKGTDPKKYTIANWNSVILYNFFYKAINQGKSDIDEIGKAVIDYYKDSIPELAKENIITSVSQIKKYAESLNLPKFIENYKPKQLTKIENDTIYFIDNGIEIGEEKPFSKVLVKDNKILYWQNADNKKAQFDDKLNLAKMLDNIDLYDVYTDKFQDATLADVIYFIDKVGQLKKIITNHSEKLRDSKIVINLSAPLSATLDMINKNIDSNDDYIENKKWIFSKFNLLQSLLNKYKTNGIDAILNSIKGYNNIEEKNDYSLHIFGNSILELVLFGIWNETLILRDNLSNFIFEKTGIEKFTHMRMCADDDLILNLHKICENSINESTIKDPIAIKNSEQKISDEDIKKLFPKLIIMKSKMAPNDKLLFKPNGTDKKYNLIATHEIKNENDIKYFLAYELEETPTMQSPM